MVKEEKKGHRVTRESRVNLGTMESREFMGLPGRREREEVLESEVVSDIPDQRDPMVT